MSQNVVIIGANRGIGLELAKQYCETGAKVYAVCRQTSEALNQLSCDVIEGIDICNDESVSSLPDKLNTIPIHVLIHNSGVLMPDAYPDINIDSMKHHFDVNTLGPLRIVQALVPQLSEGSKIGILTSRVGSIGDNNGSFNYAYRTSKCAANMIGKCLSLDLAPQGIAVALLHPGYVRTEMTGQRGLMDTDESAQGLVKIMSELTLENTGLFFHTNGEMIPW